jgi:hypothetical protein
MKLTRNTIKEDLQKMTIDELKTAIRAEGGVAANGQAKAYYVGMLWTFWSLRVAELDSAHKLAQAAEAEAREAWAVSEELQARRAVVAQWADGVAKAYKDEEDAFVLRLRNEGAGQALRWNQEGLEQAYWDHVKAQWVVKWLGTGVSRDELVKGLGIEEGGVWRCVRRARTPEYHDRLEMARAQAAAILLRYLAQPDPAKFCPYLP